MALVSPFGTDIQALRQEVAEIKRLVEETTPKLREFNSSLQNEISLSRMSINLLRRQFGTEKFNEATRVSTQFMMLLRQAEMMMYSFQALMMASGPVGIAMALWGLAVRAGAFAVTASAMADFQMEMDSH